MSKIAKSMAILGVVAGLGVAALPLSTYAVEGSQRSGDVSVQVKVDSSFAIAVDNYDVNFGTIAAGLPVVTQPVTVTVTGTVAKYDLQIADKDEDTSMQFINSEGFADSSVAGIPAGVPETNKAAWGVKYNIVGDDDAEPVFQKVGPASDPLTLVTGGVLNGVPAVPPTIEGGSDGTDAVRGTAESKITFGVSVDESIVDGTYRDYVVFIASPSA